MCLFRGSFVLGQQKCRLVLPLAYQKVYTLQENKHVNSFERLEITVKMITY